MNYNKIIDEMTSSIAEFLDSYLKNKAPFDKTFKAKVIGKISNERYQILYKGNKYTVSSSAPLSTDQIIRVCAPQNNWSELYVPTSGSTSGGGSSVAGVSGVKGSAETSYRSGDVMITPANLGLGNVENKSSSTIRSEITTSNITNALGYTPLNASGNDFTELINQKHSHGNKNVLDNITQASMDDWDLAFTHSSDTVKHVTSDERAQWNNAFSHISDNARHITSGQLTEWNAAYQHINSASNPHKITKAQIGLENADNTADADKNVFSATRLSSPCKINDIPFDGTKDIRVTDPVVKVTQAEYDTMSNNGTLDETAYYLVTDDETNNLVNNVSGYFTLAMDGWDLAAHFPDEAAPPKITFDPETWDVYYEIPDQ